MGPAASTVREIFSVRPECVPSSLRPLLSLRLTELCKIYRHILTLPGKTVVPTDLKSLLQIDLSGVRMLTSGPFGKLQKNDFLCILAIASTTHALTKARFIFQIFDENGEGRLNFTSFEALLKAILVAGSILGSGSRSSVSLHHTAINALAHSLFQRHQPHLRKDAFVALATSQDIVLQMFRHFSGGAAEERFFVEPPSELKANVEDKCPAVTRHATLMSPGQVRDIDSVPELPKRKGYFQAVQSEKEVELLTELEKLQGSRVAAAAEGLGLAELEIRDEELRKQLKQEYEDEEKRHEYRRQLHHLRLRGTRRAGSAGHCRLMIPRGHLWTVSAEHVERGGELPVGVEHPITPADVQRMITSHTTVKEKGLQEHTLVNHHPTRPMSTRGPGPPSMPPAAGQLLIDDLESQLCSDDDNVSSKKSSQAGFSKSITSQSVRGLTAGLRRGDVLLAFEMFRIDYWRKEGSGILLLRQANVPIYEKDKDMGPQARERRRNLELDLILKEAQAEALTLRSGQDITLRGFFYLLWPQITSTDVETMLRWIKKSKTKEQKVRKKEDAPKVDPSSLSGFIDLFDVLDTERSGWIHVEAIERFLCGELLTVTERRKRDSYLNCRDDMKSVSEYEFYVDHIKHPSSARFIQTVVEDRPEWAVQIPFEDKPKVPQKMSLAFDGQWLRDRQLALSRAIAQNMEELATFLDQELENASGGEANSAFARSVEAASVPQLRQGAWRYDECSPTSPRKIRLVRLYWRYLLGQAISKQLRSQTYKKEGQDDTHRPLELDKYGRLDLLGFLTVLAHDQVKILFPPSKPRPTSEIIRRLVNAFE